MKNIILVSFLNLIVLQMCLCCPPEPSFCNRPVNRSTGSITIGEHFNSSMTCQTGK